MHGKWVLISLILFTFPELSESRHSQETANFCQDKRKHLQYKDIIESVCHLVNKNRSRYSRRPLQLDAELSEVAQAHAEDMAQRDYFSHSSPEGKQAGFRLRFAGVHWRTWGENIATYHPTSSAVMKAWMNSSGHRANILNRNFGRIGIGYYQSYWVQIFTD